MNQTVSSTVDADSVVVLERDLYCLMTARMSLALMVSRFISSVEEEVLSDESASFTFRIMFTRSGLLLMSFVFAAEMRTL
jgi:hypothetical protein